MRYLDAVKLRESKKHLIGTKNAQGFYYGDLVILPSNENERNQCLKQYVLNNLVLNHYYKEDEDVVLWGIDTYHMEKDNILIYNNINE